MRHYRCFNKFTFLIAEFAGPHLSMFSKKCSSISCVVLPTTFLLNK